MIINKINITDIYFAYAITQYQKSKDKRENIYVFRRAFREQLRKRQCLSHKNQRKVSHVALNISHAHMSNADKLASKSKPLKARDEQLSSSSKWNILRN